MASFILHLQEDSRFVDFSFVTSIMRQKFHTIRNKRIKLNNSLQIKVSFPFSSRRLIVDIYNRVSEIKKRKGRYTDETKIKCATVNFTLGLINNCEMGDYFALEEGNELYFLIAKLVDGSLIKSYRTVIILVIVLP